MSDTEFNINPEIQSAIQQACDASGLMGAELVQSLWSGYGAIMRIALEGAEQQSVILKLINPPDEPLHPRGWNTPTSHARKIRSYDVETNWYRYYAADCLSECRVPRLIAFGVARDERWLLLEDLDHHYPMRKSRLTIDEAAGVLHWLARFHAKHLHVKPTGLWQIGTYWHLDTRPDEYNNMPESKLKAAAQKINELLNACPYQTLVHGDAKVANFCFSNSSDIDTAINDVAAVDFQYVGGGVGVKDVAYFLGSCLDDAVLLEHEPSLLNIYYASLKQQLIKTIDEQLAEEVVQAWRILYDVANVDFHRFLEGWMPNHTKITSRMRELTNRLI